MSDSLVRLYYLGTGDVHRVEAPAVAQFTRADDEPSAYADVPSEIAAALVEGAPDIYRLKHAQAEAGEPIVPVAKRRKPIKE